MKPSPKISIGKAVEYVAIRQGMEVKRRFAHRTDLGDKDVLILGIEVAPYRGQTEPNYRLEIFIGGKHAAGAIV